MNPEIRLHPELQSAKAHTLPTGRWALAALQTLLRLVNRWHRRRLKRVLTRTFIRSADGHQVPTLIIKPEQPQALMPALVYFHGGAFVMEAAPAHVENAVRYAAEVKCTVLFVEYRPAPQHVSRPPSTIVTRRSSGPSGMPVSSESIRHVLRLEVTAPGELWQRA